MKDYLPTVTEVHEVFSPSTPKTRVETYTEYVGGYVEDYVTKTKVITYTDPPTHRVKQIYELIRPEMEAVWLAAVVESGAEIDIQIGEWTVSTIKAASEIGKQLTASKAGSVISSERGQLTVTNVGGGQSYVARERIKNIARKNNFKTGVADRAHRLQRDETHLIMFPALSRYASILAKEKEVQDYLESLSSDITEMERQLRDAIKLELRNLETLRDEAEHLLEVRRAEYEQAAKIEREKQEQVRLRKQNQAQEVNNVDAARERQRTQPTTSTPSTSDGCCMLTGLYIGLVLFAVTKLGILLLHTILLYVSH